MSVLYVMVLIGVVSVLIVWISVCLFRWCFIIRFCCVLIVVFVFVYVVLFIVLFIDICVYDLLGVYLDSFWICDLFINEYFVCELYFSMFIWFVLVGLILVVILFEIGFWWGCRVIL